MNIEFSQIHNVVRTYQKALRLEEPARPHSAPSGDRDQVSISMEARERQQVLGAVDGQPDRDCRDAEPGR